MSSESEPRWLTAAEQDAWRTYVDCQAKLMDALNRTLVDQHSISLADYRILVLLSEADNRARRMSELADGVWSSRSRLTHQIKRLADAGLVERSTCLEDGRGVLAILTDSGFEKLRAAAPDHVASVRAHFIDLLSPEQLVVLREAFAAVDAAFMPSVEP